MPGTVVLADKCGQRGAESIVWTEQELLDLGGGSKACNIVTSQGTVEMARNTKGILLFPTALRREESIL